MSERYEIFSADADLDAKELTAYARGCGCLADWRMPALARNLPL